MKRRNLFQEPKRGRIDPGKQQTSKASNRIWSSRAGRLCKTLLFTARTHLKPNDTTVWGSATTRRAPHAPQVCYPTQRKGWGQHQAADCCPKPPPLGLAASNCQNILGLEDTKLLQKDSALAEGTSGEMGLVLAVFGGFCRICHGFVQGKKKASA